MRNLLLALRLLVGVGATVGIQPVTAIASSTLHEYTTESGAPIVIAREIQLSG